MATVNQERLLFLKNELKTGGGVKAIAKQHAQGKLTARERLERLFDEESFVETGLFVKHRCTNFGMSEKELAADGVVTGYGLIDGRLVYASSQDATIAGGSLGEMHAAKIAKLQETALKAGAPVICINDSGGARIQEGVDALGGYGSIFYNNTMASGVIPQISVIMGPCAGGAAYSSALCDFIFVVKDISKMFITGPQVLKSVTGEQVTDEDLGGASTQSSVSGVAHYMADNEDECFQQVRQLLSYLPANNMEHPLKAEIEDDCNREDSWLNDLIPENMRQAYDVKEVIESLADGRDFFEYQENYAKNIVCGFIHLGGKSIGVVANQPKVAAGCLDINASDKAARFIRTCDCFNIPLLTLVDVPGFLPGVSQEHNGIIRHGAKLLYAYSEASVPKITVIMRKAYGGAYIAMGSKHLGADMVYAWPDAEIAVMGPEGAANIIFSKQIKTAGNPEVMRQQKIEEYKKSIMNPYIAAARGFIDDIILPSQTRKHVIYALQALSGKRVQRVKKKHGNIPL